MVQVTTAAVVSSQERFTSNYLSMTLLITVVVVAVAVAELRLVQIMTSTTDAYALVVVVVRNHSCNINNRLLLHRRRSYNWFQQKQQQQQQQQTFPLKLRQRRWQQREVLLSMNKHSNANDNNEEDDNNKNYISNSTSNDYNNNNNNNNNNSNNLPPPLAPPTIVKFNLEQQQQTGRQNSLSSIQIPTTNVGMKISLLQVAITSNPTRSILFSIYMTLSGAVLGPFLDTYHSLFNVLQYDQPIVVTFDTTSWHMNSILNGVYNNPEILVTTTWVLPLFGIAGFLIGWLYILLDVYYDNSNLVINDERLVVQRECPSPPTILYGIGYFTLQYWLSGILYQSGVDRGTIFWIMSISATFGFYTFDRSISGFITSLVTAIGGPLIEVGLLSLSRHDTFFHGIGYHYTDLGETGFFPLWIIPIYFLGGPANGNLARGYWTMLSSSKIVSDVDLSSTKSKSPTCTNCNDTRCTMCPNCDGLGSYTAMGNTVVQCNACKGRGIVVCRSCFHRYDEDPYDVKAIRELMSRISPD